MDPSIKFVIEIGIFSRQWRSLMDKKLHSLGVTRARWVTLWWIAETPRPLNQKELARKIGIEGPTLVRQLDILEKDGLIERVVDRDRRSRLIRMKPAAIPIVSQIKAMADELGREVAEGIDEETLATCADVLHQMRSRLHARSSQEIEDASAAKDDESKGTGPLIAF
jgi:MarR family transcriptional regulator, transcriptional regulator for hemolysin